MKTLHRVLMTIFLCIPGSAILFSAPNAQADLYPAIGGDNEFEWITNVKFGNINNTSAQNWNGYGDYTYDRYRFTTRVRPNGSYPLSITIRPDTEWCDEYVYAFFDWNHDSDFTDSGERVAVVNATCVPGPHTVNVRVPSNAAGGETRMRVVLKYFSIPASYGKIPEGEAEDYTIVVEYPTIIGDNRSEWITNVTIGDIKNTTGQDPNGFGDYTYWKTGRTAEVNQGERYRLGVTISPDLNWCEENVTAFLDWNHDGDFTDSGERVAVAAKTCTAGPHAVYVKVPVNAVSGRTRMRIVLRWKYSPSSSGYISGEGEDYTLFVKRKKFNWVMFLPAINHK